MLVHHHERVVARGVELERHLAPRVADHVVQRAVGLRDAAERQRVLQVARARLGPQAAAGEQIGEPHRRGELAGMGARAGHGGVQDRQVRAEALERQRRRDLEVREQLGDVVQHERPAADRDAVEADERKRLLRREADRPQAGELEGPGAVVDLAAELRAPAPDEDLADVGHLVDVGLADRPELAHDRVHAVVEQVDERLQQLGAHADARGAHGVRPRDHHRPHHVLGQLAPVGRGLVGDRGDREALELVGRHRLAGERAEPGVQTVGRRAALEHLVDDHARLAHAVERRLGHHDGVVAAGDVDDVLDAQCGSVELEGRSCAGRHRTRQ